MSSHVARRRRQRLYRNRGIQCPVRTLPFRKQSVLEEDARCPAHLHCLSRPTRASCSRLSLVRFTLSSMPRPASSSKEVGSASHPCLSGKYQGLCDLPHAQDRTPESALRI